MFSNVSSCFVIQQIFISREEKREIKEVIELGSRSLSIINFKVFFLIISYLGFCMHV